MLPLMKNSRRNSSNWLPSIFEDFFNDEFMGVPAIKQFATPAVNIKESEKDYDIQIAAPGMTKEDFKININENNELVISLEKSEKNEKKQDEKKNESWIRKEFSYASYSQSFVIPENIEIDKISAKMENGVLNIVLPKKEIVETAPISKQIEIQ
ncbi:MAG: Hsp20/alpha crystallin family protein [Paludibacteraceae bacterium]|nr:Hsp20/alpha crystallin family protein [Paludibacteraceae bacterium]MBR4840118.1 Hsp20/alpha crystallin family protein [Paludibacteraceae bacterium]